VVPVAALFVRARRSQLQSWGIPLAYADAAVVVGPTLPRFETTLFPGLSTKVSVQAAIAIYSTLGSGMLAFTSIVFSFTFVMVQFSATAYSPRLVLWVARDPSSRTRLVSWGFRNPGGLDRVLT